MYLDIFRCVKIDVFRSFFAFRLEMHVRCDNQYKTGADGGNILGQPKLFECMGILVLRTAHESEIRGYLVYYANCKISISLILFKFSHSILDLTALSWIFWGDFFKAFLEWSVDHIGPRESIANRGSFIYCSLACSVLQGRVRAKKKKKEKKKRGI